MLSVRYVKKGLRLQVKLSGGTRIRLEGKNQRGITRKSYLIKAFECIICLNLLYFNWRPLLYCIIFIHFLLIYLSNYLPLPRTLWCLPHNIQPFQGVMALLFTLTAKKTPDNFCTARGIIDGFNMSLQNIYLPV